VAERGRTLATTALSSLIDKVPLNINAIYFVDLLYNVAFLTIKILPLRESYQLSYSPHLAASDQK
jgi:hypothetical protein